MTAGVCRVCGCTDTTPCTLEVEQGNGTIVTTLCWWVEPELCSGCEEEHLSEACAACDGNGYDPSKPDANCSTCRGLGVVHPEPLLYDAWGRPIDFGGGS